MNPWVNIFPEILIVLVLLVIYAVFPKIKGLHFTSLLTCPKCGHAFEYNWLPGGAFDAVRWGKYRLLRCPNCQNRSWFDIWSTKIGAD